MQLKPLSRSLAALAASLLLLASCGGGGGDGDGAAAGLMPGVPPGGSAAYAGVAGDAQSCSLDRQKNFVRAYLDEVYLWYDEIPSVDPAAYSNIPDYFNALLVRTPDASGQPRDRFSAVLPLPQAQDLRKSLGLEQASAGTLLKAHTNFVPLTQVVNSGTGRKVGYILFNDHDVGAQDDLIAAFRNLQGQGVQDLVLDLRNNSGGYLYIALAAASMITGPQNNGQVFEQLRYNAKRTQLTAQSTLRFAGTVQYGESQNPAGTPLPQLALPRVFVLTTGATCSASESIINSLRGVNVQVVRVGTTTCGKPYGFQQKNNCGYAYFPIEFQGTNAQGFGDYTGGFQPTCNVAASGTPGDPASDTLLQGALTYIDTGACPAGTATGVQSAGTPVLGASEVPRRPGWAGRLLLPQQQPR
ncbi:S41 family peptidase [Ramlibacter pallidus]|uniref:Peptidase S41 n=1 Tax=Ramlibacter pallidus TaxID=2780087 RepID=A0ABR9RYW7_9BURK|nr:S41 family peptidase [Ramlibacter pallidus]MBE7366446.1 hypothetical protein [Ramlibacter pallidus]